MLIVGLVRNVLIGIIDLIHFDSFLPVVVGWEIVNTLADCQMSWWGAVHLVLKIVQRAVAMEEGVPKN